MTNNKINVITPLLANNVFITDSMTILSRITNNEIYKEIMNETIEVLTNSGMTNNKINVITPIANIIITVG